mgnify:CR=1 FL=1
MRLSKTKENKMECKKCKTKDKTIIKLEVEIEELEHELKQKIEWIYDSY